MEWNQKNNVRMKIVGLINNKRSSKHVREIPRTAMHVCRCDFLFPQVIGIHQKKAVFGQVEDSSRRRAF